MPSSVAKQVFLFLFLIFGISSARNQLPLLKIEDGETESNSLSSKGWYLLSNSVDILEWIKCSLSNYVIELNLLLEKKFSSQRNSCITI